MKLKVLIICFFICVKCIAYDGPISFQTAAYRADSVLRLMTLEEKIGQMNQYTDNRKSTGPLVEDSTKLLQVRKGMVGSILNSRIVSHTRIYQEAAMKSRLRIPLIFGLDVINGYRTVFPIPLAEAASFDLDRIENSARRSAEEASASGINWTFAPMVDVSVDARWGRVMEGAGEDPFYGSLVAKARVKGFQGKDLGDTNSVLACAKHFAGYGAVIAGKDYNSVDMSMCHFYNYYLPPYKAAAEAGVATFMTAFNDFNSIPCTGSELLQRKILKNDWNFTGFVVSDWGSIRELESHGYASDKKEAAKLSIIAGCDMDMEGKAYIDYLKDLINEGAVDVKLLDEAVKRILIKKFQLGLFDDPFRYCSQERQDSVILSKPIRIDALEMARRSIVLLKNDSSVLPLSSKVNRIALIGALNDSQIDMRGFWAREGVVEEIVTVRNALVDRGVIVNYAEGYDLKTKKIVDLEAALLAAQSSDVVVVAIGERWDESGESKSKSNIEIDEEHQRLVTELAKVGKPIITLVMGGRPMIFHQAASASDAVLLTWWLGTEAGNAIADVLFGAYNPSAKLPMTFPKHNGQMPAYYNFKSTGRPRANDNSPILYTTGYIDLKGFFTYPFGYGLSYTKFVYGMPAINKTCARINEEIKVAINVKNTGNFDGEEVVQLYVRDRSASITRPIKELKGFKKIRLKKGEEKKVEFAITKSELGFYNNELNYIVEPGWFDFFIGTDSENLQSIDFCLLHD